MNLYKVKLYAIKRYVIANSYEEAIIKIKKSLNKDKAIFTDIYNIKIIEEDIII